MALGLQVVAGYHAGLHVDPHLPCWDSRLGARVTLLPVLELRSEPPPPPLRPGVAAAGSPPRLGAGILRGRGSGGSQGGGGGGAGNGGRGRGRVGGTPEKGRAGPTAASPPRLAGANGWAAAPPPAASPVRGPRRLGNHWGAFIAGSRCGLSACIPCSALALSSASSGTEQQQRRQLCVETAK